jgi:hypothetical protein
MPVFDWIAAAVFAAAAALLIRSGLREWRNIDCHWPLSRRFGLLVDERVAADYDRSALLIGIGCGFIAIMMADALTANLNDPGKAVSIIFAVASAGLQCALRCPFSSPPSIGRGSWWRGGAGPNRARWRMRVARAPDCAVTDPALSLLGVPNRQGRFQREQVRGHDFEKAGFSGRHGQVGCLAACPRARRGQGDGEPHPGRQGL